ncbi:polysaccharide deacetylase family protein [Mariniflexile sp.]|uniref:polysaccharide deacetylase family protein n=1 Tax=Mariniflexile sp. TaxID=1979402 RepID=UPI0035664D54
MLNRITKYFKSSEEIAIVLMYHRVCETKSDPWQLAVSPDNFESQIKAITKNFNVLPVSDLITQFNSNKIKPKSVYITFDDAYQDNYFYAKPILEKYNCPATFFVPTYFIGKKQMFWWDELEEIILHSKELPDELTFQVDLETFEFLNKMEALTMDIQKKQKNWHYTEKPPTKRCELYLQISDILKPLPFSKIVIVLNHLKTWANVVPSIINENLAMTPEQLKTLSNNKLFSFGLHTETHPALANHAYDIQLSEISNNYSFLKSYENAVINAIAYPHGNFNDTTLSIVKQNNIALGFTTSGDIITKKSSPLQLGRIQVPNCNGTLLHKLLNEWLSNL